MGGLLVAKGKAIATNFESNRIAQRGPPQHFDRCAVAETHLKEPAAHIGGAADFYDFAAATDAQFVKRAGGRGANVGATRKITGLFHRQHLTATTVATLVYQQIVF